MRLDLWAASLLLLEHSTKIWWVTYHMPSDSPHCHNGQSESHYVRGLLYIRAALLLYINNPPCLCKIPIICLRVAYIVIMSCPNLTRWEAHYISKGSSLASSWAALYIVVGSPSHILGWSNDFYLGGPQLIHQHPHQSTLYNFIIVVRHDIFCKTMTNKNTTPDMTIIHSVL